MFNADEFNHSKDLEGHLRAFGTDRQTHIVKWHDEMKRRQIEWIEDNPRAIYQIEKIIKEYRDTLVSNRHNKQT